MAHLHVITYRKNYLTYQPESNQELISDKSEEIESAFDKLVAILALILNKDKMAAQYLALSLVSRVYNRSTGLLIGDLNINLSGVSREQASLLKELIGAIHPLACMFDCTLGSLSRTRFTPTKNCNANLMLDSLFGSLVSGSLLLVDATLLEAGKATRHGVNNINALQGLIRDQAIELDFQYAKNKLPVSIPVIILSESRSFFRESLYLPL